MEAADFAVRIEEVMAEECTTYECIFEDDEEIGRIWKFQYEETIDGYIALEDNEETLGIQTIAMGLYLRDITDYTRDDLVSLFYANADFINASFSIVKIPVPIENDQIRDLDEEEDQEESETEFEEREILTIQSRIPADAFEPDDFKTYVENMLYQYQVTMEAYENDEESEELDMLDELDELDDEE